MGGAGAAPQPKARNATTDGKVVRLYHPPHFIVLFEGVKWRRTKARTWDPMIKSHSLPPIPNGYRDKNVPSNQICGTRFSTFLKTREVADFTGSERGTRSYNAKNININNKPLPAEATVRGVCETADSEAGHYMGIYIAVNRAQADDAKPVQRPDLESRYLARYR